MYVSRSMRAGGPRLSRLCHRKCFVWIEKAILIKVDLMFACSFAEARQHFKLRPSNSLVLTGVLFLEQRL